jgi:hypothetical protein
VTKDEFAFDTLDEAIEDNKEWFGYPAPMSTENPIVNIVNLTPSSALTPSGLWVQNIFYGDTK